MRTNINLTIVAMVKDADNSSGYDTCLQYNQTSAEESDVRIYGRRIAQILISIVMSNA